MADTQVRCTQCGNLIQNTSLGYCSDCGAPIRSTIGKPSLICRNLTKGDIIGIVVLVIVSAVVAVYNIWNCSDIWSTINKQKFLFNMEASYYESIGMPLPSDLQKYANIAGFYSVFAPISIISYSAVILVGIMMVIRLRFSFKIAIPVYVIEAVVYVANALFCLFSGIDFKVVSIVWGVIIRVGLIKTLISLVAAAKAELVRPSQSAYSAPMPVQRYEHSIDPVTGQMSSTPASHTASIPTPVQPTMQSVGAPTPVQPTMQSVGAPTPVQPTMQSVGAPTPAQPTMQSVGAPAPVQPTTGISLAKPTGWQCRGCGAQNDAAYAVCPSCGTPKE